jgi:hypothetical protein
LLSLVVVEEEQIEQVAAVQVVYYQALDTQ